jgi:hypothetical protein
MKKRKVGSNSRQYQVAPPPLVGGSQKIWFEYLLEEEMVLDELVLGLLVHTLEGIELASEVSLEGLECLGDLGHDLKSLSLGKSGSKGEVSEVSADSDSSRDDHTSLILGKGRGNELLSIHVRNVLGVLSVLVIVLNDLVKEGSESLVGVMRTGVATDAGIGVLGSGEDGLTESESVLVLLVSQLVPNLS